MLSMLADGHWQAAHDGKRFFQSGDVTLQYGENGHFGVPDHVATITSIGCDSHGPYRCYVSRYDLSTISVVRTLTTYESLNCFSISFLVTNTSRENVRLSGVRILDGLLYLSVAATKALTNAWERCGSGEYVEQLTEGKHVHSAWNACVYDARRGLAIAMGVLSGRQMFTSFKLAGEGPDLVRLEAGADTRSDARGVIVPPGESWESDRITVASDRDPYRALETYAELVRRHNGIEWRDEIAVGWCDWYHYYGANSQETILENLAAIDDRLKGYGVQFIQIDDGWQHIKEFGHYAPLNLTFTTSSGAPWDENQDFRMGMKALAAEIHRRGYKAGLWVRPFSVMDAAVEYQRGEPWVCRYGESDPMPKRAHLDIADPAALDWLKALFRKFVHEWGFDYVKYDFITYDILRDQTFDLPNGDLGAFRLNHGNVTSAHAYHSALEAFRAAAGTDAFLLGCNCLAGSAIGVVDGLRISGDVCLGSWDLTKKMLRSSAYRYYQNRFFWQNDPDVLHVAAGLPRSQAIFWASLVSLSGGMILLGDAIAELPDDRIEILKKVLPPHNGAAKPLRLFEEPSPTVWRLTFERPFAKWDIVGLFNWNDTAADVAFDLSEPGLDANKDFHVFDFWGDHYLGVHRGRFSARLAGNECIVLSLRECRATPQLIGTHYHISQGATEITSEIWDAESNALRIGTAGVPGSHFELYASAPLGFRIDAATVDAVACGCSTPSDGIVKLEFDVPPHSRQDLEIHFAKEELWLPRV